MSEDNCREPYSVAKNNFSRANSPTEALPNIKTLSSESEELITFLKSMTRSTIENIDPFYEDITFEESLRLQINKKIDLTKALQNPHLVIPKVKFNFELLKHADTAFGWYQLFVYIAEWARGIPQFRMLKSVDQERLFHLNFATLSIPFSYFLVSDLQKFKDLVSSADYFKSTKHIGKNDLLMMSKKLIETYEIHLIDICLKLKPDDEEMALGMTLMLFQFSESLSNEGHLICSKYKEKLYTALYEYQMIKFADKTELERIQRYTMLMELMHRVTKIWSEECEYHLILSTFDETNVDGLLKKLLFTECLNT
uniref:NR LBD domain-containing protein n=1 Tax=Panagrolaimus sp. PS1159 TaxID=55785 RepID=A0AC35GCN1_9BILA